VSQSRALDQTSKEDDLPYVIGRMDRRSKEEPFNCIPELSRLLKYCDVSRPFSKLDVTGKELVASHLPSIRLDRRKIGIVGMKRFAVNIGDLFEPSVLPEPHVKNDGCD